MRIQRATNTYRIETTFRQIIVIIYSSEAFELVEFVLPAFGCFTKRALAWRIDYRCKTQSPNVFFTSATRSYQLAEGIESEADDSGGWRKSRICVFANFCSGIKYAEISINKYRPNYGMGFIFGWHTNENWCMLYCCCARTSQTKFCMDYSVGKYHVTSANSHTNRRVANI